MSGSNSPTELLVLLDTKRSFPETVIPNGAFKPVIKLALIVAPVAASNLPTASFR